MQTTPPTGWDKLHRCVGCDALLTGPCLPGGALVTGAFTACVILRAAVEQLALHTAGGGCRIDFAIPSTLDLADEPRAEDLTAIALASLTDRLIRSGNASGSRDQVVYRYGLKTAWAQAANALNATAAWLDGTATDSAPGSART